MMQNINSIILYNNSVVSTRKLKKNTKMDRNDFYSNGAVLERVHQFERLGLMKYCILVNRFIVPAFETCNGIVEISGSCAFARIYIQRTSKHGMRIWYDRFSDMDHKPRDLAYDINSVAKIIEDAMKQIRGTMIIRAPGLETKKFHYNQIGW